MRLLSITTLLLVGFLFSTPLYASVRNGSLNGKVVSYVYTSQPFDLNNDGSPDVQMTVERVGSTSSYHLRATGLNGSKVERDSDGYIKRYYTGEILGSGTYRDDGITSYSTFPPGTRAYIGLKILVNGKLCCAYLEIEAELDQIFSQGAYYFYSYGYETNSNICISAGVSNAVTGPNLALSPITVPGSSAGMVSLILRNAGHYRVEAFNALGQSILVKPIEVDENSKNKPVPLSGFASGMYILSIISNDRRLSLRFIVE